MKTKYLNNNLETKSKRDFILKKRLINNQNFNNNFLNNQNFRNNQNYIISKKTVNNAYYILNHKFTEKGNVSKNHWVILYKKYSYFMTVFTNIFAFIPYWFLLFVILSFYETKLRPLWMTFGLWFNIDILWIWYSIIIFSIVFNLILFFINKFKLIDLKKNYFILSDTENIFYYKNKNEN